MSRNNPGQPRADLSAWGVEILRLTTFHTALSERGAGVWSDITNREPDTVNDNRKAGEYTENGPWEEMSLVLQVQSRPPRVDWVLAAQGDIFESGMPYPPFPDKLTAFVGLMS